MDWIPLETSTYQDHVIKHVLGATVLGWVAIGDALHLVLDVGLLWTIYLNAEMNLMALSVAIQDLQDDDVSHADMRQLAADAQALIEDGREAQGLVRFRGAPVNCAVVEVEILQSGAHRRIIIRGEANDLEIETSDGPSPFSINFIGGSFQT